jgi:hypothetical protein
MLHPPKMLHPNGRKLQFGREGVRPFGKITAQFQEDQDWRALYPQDHPQMRVGF